MKERKESRRRERDKENKRENSKITDYLGNGKMWTSFSGV